MAIEGYILTDWEKELLQEEEVDVDVELNKETMYEFEPWRIIYDAMKAGYYNKPGGDAPTRLKVKAMKKVMTFLRAYVTSGSLQTAGEAAGWSQLSTFKVHCRQDPHVAKAWAHCEDLVADLAEDEIRRRGIHGFTEKTVKTDANGTEITIRNKVSDRLLVKFIEGAKPDKYARRQHHDVSIDAKIGVAIITATPHISAEDWEKGAIAMHANQKMITLTAEKPVDVSKERAQTAVSLKRE